MAWGEIWTSRAEVDLRRCSFPTAAYVKKQSFKQSAIGSMALQPPNLGYSCTAPSVSKV